MNIDVIAVCIESITTEDGTEVTDRKFITEYIENASREIFNQLKEKTTEIIESHKTKPIPVTCGSCGTEYQAKLEFNQANFFGNGF